MLKISPLFVLIILGIHITACTEKESTLTPSISFTNTVCPDESTSCDSSQMRCPKGYIMALGCGGCTTTPRTFCEVECATKECVEQCYSHCKKCTSKECPECALKPCKPNFSHCRCFLHPASL